MQKKEKISRLYNYIFCFKNKNFGDVCFLCMEKLWNSSINPKYNFLLHTINSNKTHSALTNFMASDSSSKILQTYRRLSNMTFSWRLMTGICISCCYFVTLVETRLPDCVCPGYHYWKTVTYLQLGEFCIFFPSY